MDEKDLITPSEFALKVKNKYPQYKDVDDSILVQKMVEKYPEYKNKINFNELQPPTPQDPKKAQADVSGGLGLASANTTSSSESVSPKIKLQERAINELVEEKLNQGVKNYQINPQEINQRVSELQVLDRNTVKFDRSKLNIPTQDLQGMQAYADTQQPKTKKFESYEDMAKRDDFQHKQHSSNQEIDFAASPIAYTEEQKQEFEISKPQTVSKIYGEDLDQYGIDTEDFNGYIEGGNDRVKKLYKKGFYTDDTTDFFQSSSDEKLIRETSKHNTLSEYVTDRIGFLRGKYLGLINTKDFEKAKEVEAEMRNLGNGYQKYVEDKLPTYKKAVEDKLLKEYDEYKDQKTIKGIKKKRGVSDLQKELGDKTFGSLFRGINTATSNMTSSLLDLIGADDQAEYQRMIKETNDEFDRNSLEYGVVSGKKINYKGKNLLVSNKGRIIDLDEKKDVTSIAKRIGVDNEEVIEKAKSLKEEITSYSPLGLVSMASETIGDLAVQLATTRGAINAAGTPTKLKALGTSMAVQSGMVASSVYEDTLSQLRKANIDDEKSKAEAAELALEMGIITVGTSFISPDLKALGVTTKGVNKDFSKKIAKAYVEGGKEGVKKSLKQQFKEKGINVLEEGGKELIEEFTQNIAQKELSKGVNEEVGKNVLDTSIDRGEIIETAILSQSAGLMALRANTPSDYKDRLSMLEYYSQDVQQATDFINNFKEEGALSEANADKLIKDINNYAKYSNKIPEDVPVERVEPLLELLDKRNELELRKKNQDKAFHKEINEEIEKVDSEIANIRKPQETKEVVEQPITKEVEEPAPIKEETKPVVTTEKEGVPLRRPVGRTVKDSINREVRINSIGESKFVRPVNGDLYLDGQRVVLDTRDGKEYELGNIDEIGDLDINDFEGFEITFEKPNVNVNKKGNIEYRGNEFKTPNSVDKVTKIAGDGSVTAIKLKPLSGGKQVTLRGQDAIDAYYQLKLSELETDLQKQKVDKILIKEIQDESRRKQSERKGNNRSTKKPSVRKTARDTKETPEKPKLKKDAEQLFRSNFEDEFKGEETKLDNETISKLESAIQENKKPSKLDNTLWTKVKDVVSESLKTYKDVELAITKGLQSLRSTKEYQKASSKDKQILEDSYLDYFKNIIPRESNKKGYQKVKDLVKRLVQRKRQIIVDSFTSINEQIKNLEGFRDFLQEQGLFESKAAAKANGMIDNVIKHLKTIAKSGFTRKQVSDYMRAIDAINRNKFINENIDDKNPYGSGTTDKQARLILDQYTDKEIKKLEELAKPFYDLIEETRKQLAESGLMSKEAVDKLREVNPTYVPQTGFSDEQIDIGDSIVIGKKINIKGRTIKKMVGSKTEANDIIANIMFQYNDIHLKGSKNVLLNNLLDIYYKNPKDTVPFNVYTDETLPKKKVRKKDKPVEKSKQSKETQLTIDESIKPKADKVTEVKEPAQNMESYVGIKRDGKQLYLKFDNDVLAKNLNRATDATVDSVTKFMGSFNRYLSVSMTAWNPEFLIPNFARDFEAAFINLKSQADINLDLKGKDLSTKVAKRTFSAIKTLWKNERGKKLSDEEQKYINEFLDNGGKTGWSQKMSLYETTAKVESVEKLFRPAETTKQKYLNNVKKGVNNLVDFMDDASGSVENGVRLATFIEARKAGLTPKQAASLSKELTVNFNRKGEMGTLANTLFLFFNAAVQGNFNFVKNMGMFKTYVDSEGKTRKTLSRGQKFALGLMSFSSLMTLYNMGVSEEDEESGLYYYDKISDYDKERNLIIMHPNGKDYFKIPLPYGYNTVFGLGSMLVEAGWNKVDSDRGKSVASASGFLTGQFVGSFSPFQLPEGSGARKFWYSITPTIAKPLVELAENRDYRNNPIYAENFPMSNKKLADAHLGSKNTAIFYKQAAILANSLTGGNEYEEGLLGFHPDKAQYIASFLGGGVGKFFTKTYSVGEDTVLRAMGADVETEVRNIPLLNKVYGEPNYFKEMNIYYDVKSNIQDRLNYLNSKKGKKIDDKDRKLLKSLNDSYSSYDLTLKDLRKIEEGIRSKPFSVDNVSLLEKIEAKKKQAIANFVKIKYLPIKKKLSKNYE